MGHLLVVDEDPRVALQTAEKLLARLESRTPEDAESERARPT